MVAKFADHLPLYRQEKIFGCAGLPISRSTLAQWLGNCGVQLQSLADALREAVLAYWRTAFSTLTKRQYKC
ncbi:transposase [Pseudomonas sp. GM55]|nr:transposase [Pseudomonas sp. GM55]